MVRTQKQRQHPAGVPATSTAARHLHLLLLPLLLLLHAATYVSGSVTVFGAGDSTIQAVPHSYIVKYKDFTGESQAESTNSRVQSLMSEHSGLQIRHDYGTFGLALDNVPESVLSVLQEDTNVEAIEVDQIFTTQQDEDEVELPPPTCYSQNTLLWGLSRIDQDSKPTDSVYKYEDTSGSEVVVYVVDTGIDTSHRDFEGRAKFGAAFCLGCTAGDDNGHGTHVAGTIGGGTYGVAKAATLYGVKVLNRSGNGRNSDIIRGLRWIKNHWDRVLGKPLAVINMSLGGGISGILDAAVNSAHENGLSVVVAAGNDNINACSQSPARATHAITVACTDIRDRRCSFSNWGPCVTLFAPGQNIRSARPGGGSSMKSGTSMAAPHVAGVVARYRALCPVVGPDDVTKWLLNTEWPTGVVADKVADPRRSPNRLLRFDCTAPFPPSVQASIQAL